MKVPVSATPSIIAGSTTFTTANATRYLQLAGQITAYDGGNVFNTTEGAWRVAAHSAGEISGLAIGIASNARTTDVTFTLMVNGVATTQQVVVPGGSTGWHDTTGDPVSVAQGDLLSVRMQTGSGSQSINIRNIESSFEAFGAVTQHFITSGAYNQTYGTSTSAASAPASGTTESNGFVDYWGATGSEGAWAGRVQTPGTASRFRAHIPANASNQDLRIEVYVNGSASGLGVTVPAGTTGVFEDTSTEVALATGALVTIRRVSLASGSGSYRIGNMQFGVEYDDDAYDVWSLRRGNYTLQGYNGAVHYLGSGPYREPADNENNAWRRVRSDEGALSHLWAFVSISGVGADWPITLRQNNVDTSLSITAAAGSVSSTRYVDSVNQLAIASDDVMTIGFQTTNFSQSVMAWGFTVEGGGAEPVEIDAGAGALEFGGKAPAVITDEFVSPGSGALELTGQQPVVIVDLSIDAFPGALRLTGFAPLVSTGITVDVPAGSLEFGGHQPFIATDLEVLATQQAVLVLGALQPLAQASQQAALLLAEIVPDVAASQQAVLILADGAPCVTERCQIWTITRRDGEVFRFTSHDRDVLYGGQVYGSCHSLMPSASENASTLGSTGNIELEGIIDSDAITEADLYGGLFDDAYVTVDLISWGALAEAPRRLASGWTGELSQGETGFKMEVLGAGARLDQQALVQMVTPGCRWTFGDARCGVDVEALAIDGTVTGAPTRSRLLVLLDGAEGGLQWANGRIRFTSGVNDGQVLEVKSVDFDAGVIELWPSAAFRAEPGDAFDLLPGCDLAKTGGCTVYANIINFGGFPDVPGSDAILETPDAQY